MLVLFIMSAWIVPSTVKAQSPNVADCIENAAICESMDKIETVTPKNNQQSDAQTENQTAVQDSPNMLINFLKLILSLALVLALIYILLKLVNRKNKLYQKHHTLENMGGISLGAQKSMQIIRIGQQFYVIGVGDNIEMLTEITDKKTIEDLMKNEANSDFDPTALVSSIFGKNKKENVIRNEEKSNFASVFTKELDSLQSGRKKTIDEYLNKGEKNNE